MGERFHLVQWVQITQSRPRSASNAMRRPTGNSSMTSFVPSDSLQNRQVVYMTAGRRTRSRFRVVGSLSQSTTRVLYARARCAYHTGKRSVRPLVCPDARYRDTARPWRVECCDGSQFEPVMQDFREATSD